MRRAALVVAASIMAYVAYAATDVGALANEPLEVAASVQPVAFLVQELGGPDVNVTVLVPPGASPHAFEPLPGDVRRIAGARLFVRVGGGFDDWMQRLANAAPRGIADHALVSEFAEDRAQHTGARRHGHGHVDGDDPHVWLDPLLVRDEIAPRLAARLASLDPTRRDRYEARLAAFQRSLSALDHDLARRLEAVRGRHYVAFHNAWRRFSARYGLAELGVVQEFGGEEPTPRELARLITKARQQGVAALLIEPQLDPRIARAMAGEFAGGTATVDPLGDPRDPARADYASLLRFNADVFARALAPASAEAS